MECQAIGDAMGLEVEEVSHVETYAPKSDAQLVGRSRVDDSHGLSVVSSRESQVKPVEARP